MYQVVIIRLLNGERPAHIDALPTRGEVINTAANFFPSIPAFKSMSHDDAIEVARGYNTQEIHQEVRERTWAIVQSLDQPVVPGALILLQNANQLN